MNGSQKGRVGSSWPVIPFGLVPLDAVNAQIAMFLGKEVPSVQRWADGASRVSSVFTPLQPERAARVRRRADTSASPHSQLSQIKPSLTC